MAFHDCLLLQRTISEIQIDFLTRKLVDADSYPDEKPSSLNRSTVLGDGAKCLRESEGILVIKQLQEKVRCFRFMLLFLLLFFVIVNLVVICFSTMSFQSNVCPID